LILNAIVKFGEPARIDFSSWMDLLCKEAVQRNGLEFVVHVNMINPDVNVVPILDVMITIFISLVMDLHPLQPSHFHLSI